MPKNKGGKKSGRNNQNNTDAQKDDAVNNDIA